MRHPYLGVSKNNGTPQISHFNRAFHYKPSILGETPLFKETTHLVKVKKFGSKNPWLSSWNRSGRPMNGDPPKQWCASGAWGIFSGAGNFRTWWFKVTFLGWLSDPCKGLSDLQLEDEKVTLNHLAEVFFCFFLGREVELGHCFSFSPANYITMFWYVFLVTVVHSFPPHVGCDLPRPTEVPSTVFPGCGSCLFGQDCAFSHLFHGYVYAQYL